MGGGLRAALFLLSEGFFDWRLTTRPSKGF